MADWEIGQVNFQRKDGASWSYDDWTVEAGTFYTFRGWFTVINGSGPINLGNLQVERFVGGEWENWPGTLAKNIEPGHGIVSPEFVVYTNTIFITQGTHTMRLRVEWDNGPYYSDALPTQASPLLVTGQSQTIRVTARGRVLETTASGNVRAANAQGHLAEAVAGSTALGADAVGRSLAAVAEGHVLEVDAVGRELTAAALGHDLSVDANGNLLETVARSYTAADARGRTRTAAART